MLDKWLIIGSCESGSGVEVILLREKERLGGTFATIM